MPKAVSARTLINKHVRRGDRVLLINPPVEETRYSWIRWNQPVDLLKIGGYLKTEVGCAVELLDLMKPEADGKVPEEWLPGNRRYRTVEGERYPMRRFGRPYGDFTEWLLKRRSEDRAREPTQVWITSLCSYWFQSVAEMCRTVRQVLPDVRIVLLGQYPLRMPDHAAEHSIADFVITKAFPLEDQPSDLDLYGTAPPPFVALRLNAKVALKEIRSALDRRITNFTFFEDDIGRDGGGPLEKIVGEARAWHRHIRFHAICGLHPDRVTPVMASLLADPKVFASVHFEEADLGSYLDNDAYVQARRYLTDAGMELPDSRLSGFVWIGRPRDNLEELVRRSFQVLDHFGGLILKPFTPVPGTADHEHHATYLAKFDLLEWSPHFFPFADLNGISRGEYHDLYRLAAFLNEKIRSRSFDFLAGSLGATFLRHSLQREAWKLEPSPLRVINQSADL